MCRCSLLLAFTGLLAGLLAPPPASADFVPSGLLEIHVIDIGQANAALVIGPNGKKVMLEAGAVADGKIYDYLIDLGMVPGDAGDKLDYTLAGHLHADHYRGFRRIFPPPPAAPDWIGFQVTEANYYNDSPLIEDDENPNGEMFKYKDAAGRTEAGPPQPIPMDWQLVLGDDAWMRVVAVNGHVYDYNDPEEYIEPQPDEENDRSVAILIHYGGFDLLWASDLTGGDDEDCVLREGVTENDVESPLARALTPEPDGTPESAPPLLTELGVDVLHVNHHGSETSTNSFYIGRLQPEVALLSVGSHGTYKHPRKLVVDDVLLAPPSECKPAPPALVLQTSESYPDPPASSSGYCVGDMWIMTDGLVYGIGAGGGSPDERGEAGLPAYFVVDDVAPECPMEITLSDLVIDFPWEWRAKHRISSAGSVRLVEGADILLQAGSKIALGDGFMVERGARLTLGLEPFTDCSAPT